MNHMLAHDEKLGDLPYDMFITKIFKYFNVKLSNELCIKMISNGCVININIIYRKMGVLYDPVVGTFKYLDE